MNDITLLDNYGNVLHYFTQWDINQMIYIEESGFAKAPQFHFQNLKTATAYVVQSSMDSSGKVSVMVPNELTVVSYPIDIYIYVSDSDSSQTVYHTTIPVYPRKQPNDLIYEDNMEFITISELEERIEKLKDILDGFAVSAGDIAYDNSVSGLDATNVQDALDELVEKYVFVDKEFDDGGIDISKVTDMTYLYNEGVESDLIGEYSAGLHYMDAATCTLSKESDHILFSTSAYSSGWANLCPSKNPDLTSYNICGIEYDYTGESLSDSTSILKMFAADTNSATDAELTGIMHPFIIQEGKNLLVAREMPMSFYLTPTSYLIFHFDCFGYKPAGELKIRKIWVGKYDWDGIDEDDNSGDTSDDATKASNAKYVIEEAINNMSVNNTTNTFDIQSVVDTALTEAGITDVTATVADIVNTNATTEATGTVTGVVDIVCGTASDSVDINKIITIMLEEDAQKVSIAKNMINFHYVNHVSSFDTSITEEQCLALTEYGLDLYNNRVYKDLYDSVSDDVDLNIRNFIYDRDNSKVTYDVIISYGTAADVYSVSKKMYVAFDSDLYNTLIDMSLTYIESGFNCWDLSNNTTEVDIEESCHYISGKYGIIVNISDYVIVPCTSVDSAGSLSCTVSVTYNGETKGINVSIPLMHIPDNGENVYLYNEGVISPWIGNVISSGSTYATTTMGTSEITIEYADCNDENVSSARRNLRFENRVYMGDFSKMCVQYDFECNDIDNCGEIRFGTLHTNSTISSLWTVSKTLTSEVSDAIGSFSSFHEKVIGALNTCAYHGLYFTVNKPIKACTLKIKKIWLEP